MTGQNKRITAMMGKPSGTGFVRFKNHVLPTGFYTHRFLGTVKIDDACTALQTKNPDKSSVFVIYNDETREVTKYLLRPLKELLSADTENAPVGRHE